MFRAGDQQPTNVALGDSKTSSMGTPPPAATGGRGSSPLRWPILAITITSGLWAACLISLQATDHHGAGDYMATTPDLRGYHIDDSPCNVGDFGILQTEGFQIQAGGTSRMALRLLRHEAEDSSECSVDLRSSDRTAMAVMRAAVHKKSNPIPFFRAQMETAEPAFTNGERGDVEIASGLGDLAYFVTGFHGMATTLRVRDGWFVYEATWQDFGSSENTLPREVRKRILTTLATEAMTRYRR